MSKTIILFLISIAVFCSCEKSKSENEELQTGLNGKWNLVSFEYCGSDGDAYNKGDIIWNFDTITNTISIVNTISFASNSPNDFQIGGNYSYTLVDDREWANILIYYNEWEYYLKYSVVEHVMKLDGGCGTDGFLVLFER